jgi:hypothetical protein
MILIELVPKLIDYALKRMVRKLCLRWNKLLQFFRLKPYKTAEFKVAGQAWLVDKQSLSPKTEVLEQPRLLNTSH